MLMKQLLEAKDVGLSGEASASAANNETLNTSEYGQGLDQSHQTNTQHPATTSGDVPL